MARPLRIKKDDKGYSVSSYLKGQDGATVVLAGTESVRFVMRAKGQTTPKVNGTGGITDAVNGLVFYTFLAADLDTVGLFDQEWEITYPGGTRVETYPASRYNEIEVIDDLN
jgi:hypothetical protein